MRLFKTGLVVLWSMLMIACSADVPAVADCGVTGGITPHCKFKNPEDAVVLANGQMIVSQMGNLEERSPGSLVLFDPDRGTVTRLFGQGYSTRDLGDTRWGNLDCTANPREFFSPHGISLLKRADDRLQLMVVNHGRRESVEFFEVFINDSGVSTVWRGCVRAPHKEFLNDLVALPDGGFIASNMYVTRGPQLFGLHFGALKALLGMDSGYLIEWHPWQDVTVVRGSEGPFPNGLAISPDGRFIYQNLYGADEVRKLDRQKGVVVASIAVAKPDNTTIDAKGRLLVASQKMSLLDLKSCVDEPDQTCLLPFEIVQIDPDTMAHKVVFKHAGPPMGAGTVAVQHGDNLVMGSFLGDRMIIAPYSGR